MAAKQRTPKAHNFQDLTGRRFGRLKVLRFAGWNPSGRTRWLCLCKCGQRKVVTASNLKTGCIQSCGCRRIGAQLQNLAGKRFGSWKVLHRGRVRKNGPTYWWCRCDCGTIREIHAGSLKAGASLRCQACSKKVVADAVRTHGESKSKEYQLWAAMKARCTNQKSTAWPRYGGRGIKVCRRWMKSFTAFLKDMGRRPSAKHSLDRFPDGNGDYKPGNVRWATAAEQRRNKDDLTLVTYRGKTLCLTDWSKRLNIHLMTLRHRILHLRWPAEKAFTTPPRNSGGRLHSR